MNDQGSIRTRTCHKVDSNIKIGRLIICQLALRERLAWLNTGQKKREDKIVPQKMGGENAPSYSFLNPHRLEGGRRKEPAKDDASVGK